jgi:hypothetical protein
MLKKIIKTKEEKFNPIGCIPVLLYYPALGFAIRAGFSMYYYLFDDLIGFSILFGVIATLLITVVFLIIVLFILNGLIQLSDKIFKLISSENQSESNDNTTEVDEKNTKSS